MTIGELRDWHLGQSNSDSSSIEVKALHHEAFLLLIGIGKAFDAMSKAMEGDKRSAIEKTED
jgi:hypothetical protein